MKEIIVPVLVIVLFSITIFSAFGQTQEFFSLKTSEKSYEEGEIIVVSGNVTTILQGAPVSIQILREGNLVDISQVLVAQDGKFTSTFKATGPLWKQDGTYIVRALYGTTTLETNFQFFTKGAVEETTDSFEVDAGSYGTFDVSYTVRGATVNNMLVESNIFALIVIIDSDDDGTIILDLPRQSIDAKKSDGSDDTFIILIDGIEVPYEEISTNEKSRRITVDFEEGDSDIEIIGTFVVPEFGNIALMILTLSLVSIIFLSSKNRIINLKT
jgi:predicted secreted protein with PEFG-CTERM motif